MSTIAPPSKPLSPALVDSEHYIDDQIRRTRRALKLVDLAAGLITLAIGLLTFVLLAALLDHWVVPGGLNEAGRLAVFGLMLVALAWYGWRQFVPLLRPINPVYAAHTIERGTPTLKNSLLNLLLFRTHRQHMSARVYHALEQQAAQRLSTAPVDARIDRTALLRLGYALLLIIAVCAVYSVLSPKNMAVSVARVLAPWSDLQAPSRVHIMNIRPGDISVARGERLEVEATIAGLRADDAVRVRYSTTDEQLVDESVAMKTPDPNIGRFTAELPRKDAAAGAAGVEQDFVYWIEAGDAKSKKFNVTVFSRPTIIVQKVRYEYPAYTGYPSTDVENTGDIRGLEGTQVTISALANQPIKSAYVDFDADGRSDLRMTAEGDRATASFTLGLREDRRTPKHISYMLKFTTVEGRANIDPPKYRIDVTPDYAPEVRITAPEEPELTVRVDEIVPIGVEARDPDFALSNVRLVGKVGDREATLAELLSKRQEGPFGHIKPFTPGDVRLKAGDVLEYWAEARDNRRPEANVAASEHRRLKIAGPADQQAKPPAGGQQGQPQNGKGQQGEPASAGGQQGQGGEQQQGDNAGGNGEGGEESQGQQGPGGAGAQGEQNEKAEGEQGGGGQGQSGQSQASDAQQEQQGQGGGSSANNADPSQNPQQQPTNGANNGAGKAGQPQHGQQQPGDPASQPGESASADGQQGQQPPGDPSAQQPGQPQAGGAQTGNPQDAQPGAQQAAPQEKVSSKGDEDSTAFQRMAEHLNKQSGEQSANQQGKSASGESASADGQQREQSQQPQTGAAQKPGEAASRTQGQQGAAGNSASQKPNAQQEGADPARSQENPANQAEQSAANASPPDKSSSTAGASKNATDQKPTAEGAQPNEPRQPSGDAQQQQLQGAGQDANQRQGADVPRESKPGDGNPQDNQSAQQPSAESNVSNNQSNAGAGHNSDKQEGSASTFDKRAADKQNEGDRNKKLTDDEEPPSGSDSKRESDSDGGQSGDQAGGGQEGPGQHADAPGKGAPGQNEAADTGGGRADEQGQGETGSKAGNDQVAEGKTGQSSGDQKGQGNQQGKAGEQSKAGESDSAAGEPASAGGQKQQQPAGDQGPQNQGGEQSADQQSADKQSAQGEPASAGGQQGKGGEQSSEQPDGGQSGSSQPQGGGPGGAATASGQQLTEEAKEDEANLKFAREQTDLVLERLDEQLAKKQVDANLLKSLGWSEEELRQFVGRWKDLKTRVERPGDDANEARDELDDALRSLGLRPQGPTRVRASAKADKLRVNDSYRARAPVEYADRVRLYSKNISSGEDE